MTPELKDRVIAIVVWSGVVALGAVWLVLMWKAWWWFIQLHCGC